MTVKLKPYTKGQFVLKDGAHGSLSVLPVADGRLCGFGSSCVNQPVVAMTGEITGGRRIYYCCCEYHYKRLLQSGWHVQA